MLEALGLQKPMVLEYVPGPLVTGWHTGFRADVIERLRENTRGVYALKKIRMPGQNDAMNTWWQPADPASCVLPRSPLSYAAASIGSVLLLPGCWPCPARSLGRP